MAEKEYTEQTIQEALSGCLVNPDPWIHRSSAMSCATCMWFVEKRSTTKSPTLFGRCRRHAPTMSGYPAVFGNDWCGDHKLDENKV